MSARIRVFGVLVLALVGGVFGASATTAQEATPATLPDQCTVVTDGLVQPRDIAVGSDGSVYVVDGGDDAGRVSRIAPEGSITIVAEELAVSVADEAPSGLAVDEIGQVHVVLANGAVAKVVEDGSQEVVLDGLPHPTGIAFDSDGALLLAAGGETGQLLRCDLSVEFAAVTDVTISMQDIFFEPNEVAIPANTDVTLHVVNDGFVMHNLSIPAAGVTTPILASGAAHDVVLNLPPGVYEITCDVRGHKGAGMVGILHVAG
ncbi:MAG TPA: cupredoxin domain-containing protein [Thermomicrobiales bacterium]|nr:cupredoxin domain-containing protein [Thermomicrobiales bacterium]